MPWLKPAASSADRGIRKNRGIRKKKLTPKKTAMIQIAINPTEIR
jgi:hypothetical protein